MFSFQDLLAIVLTLIAVINPFGTIPLFMGMVEDLSHDKQNKIFNTILRAGLSIILGFTLIGNFIMKNLFNVTIREVAISGGLILITVSLKSLLFDKKKSLEEVKQLSDEEAKQMGITPMAFPILVGPGTMTTILVLREKYSIPLIFLGSIITFGIIAIFLKNSRFVERIFGRLVLFLLSRIMQLFLMATGVSLILKNIPSL